MRPADRIPRFVLTHAAIGAIAGAGLTAAIAAFDVAGLRSLAEHAQDGWLALAFLAIGLIGLFASLALGSGLFLMRIESAARPAGQRVAALVPVPVRARRRSRWKV